MMNLFRRHLDDMLLLSGCICIGVSAFMVHLVIGFLAIGIEMIALAVLIGARNATD